MHLPTFESAEAFARQPPITVGIAAMDKKTRSIPMKELLRRLESNHEFEIIVFGEALIMEKPVEEWPKKAIAYAKLHEPFLVNDLAAQLLLLDRRKVYDKLVECGVPMPRHVIMNRDSPFDPNAVIEEHDEFLVINGVKLNKPVVEKPISGEDHNINVYYPASQGGGCRRLFRKVKNRSSDVISESVLRRNGSFLYEEFIPSGRDVKVYTVGPDFAYAESRKSPTVDGIVERNRFGKERRETERLSEEERAMVSRVCLAFSQNVCGLDMLRDGKRSYVIDVNGWSFVKGSPLYYDTCASILRLLLLRSPQVQPVLALRTSRVPSGAFVDAEKGDALLGVFCVFRHADRTPKQKLKLHSDDAEILSLARSATPACKEIKLKSSESLQELCDAIKQVLTRRSMEKVRTETLQLLAQVRDVLDARLNGTKVQLKAVFSNADTSDEAPKLTAVRVICKWGGEMTAAGEAQSLSLGRLFSENMLPLIGGDEQRTRFLKDAEVWSSDERRVLLSAKAFVKGFTGCEDPDISITADRQAQRCLNSTAGAKELIDESKGIIQQVLDSSRCLQKLSEVLNADLDSAVTSGVRLSLLEIDDPSERLSKLYLRMSEVVQQLSSLPEGSSDFYGGESTSLILARWEKLLSDLYNRETRVWDATTIPNVYDSAKFDTLHNSTVTQRLSELWVAVLRLSKLLADFVVPQEYGITPAQKSSIGEKISRPLLDSIVQKCRYVDTLKAEESAPGGRCALYFTSESHLHALRNLLLWRGLCSNDVVASRLERIELAYCAHLLVRVYEDFSVAPSHPMRRYLSLHCSPGASEAAQLASPPHIQHISAPLCVHARLPLHAALQL